MIIKVPHSKSTTLCVCRDKVTTQAGLNNVLGALYASVLFFAVINALIVQPVLSAERAVSYRERAAGMYSFFPWTLALVSSTPPTFSHLSADVYVSLHAYMFQLVCTLPQVDHWKPVIAFHCVCNTLLA